MSSFGIAFDGKLPSDDKKKGAFAGLKTRTGDAIQDSANNASTSTTANTSTNNASSAPSATTNVQTNNNAGSTGITDASSQDNNVQAQTGTGTNYVAPGTQVNSTTNINSAGQQGANGTPATRSQGVQRNAQEQGAYLSPQMPPKPQYVNTFADYVQDSTSDSDNAQQETQTAYNKDNDLDDAQISTIADFLATRPKKTVEEYEKEQERKEQIEKISRGLKALANVFTTAQGGVNTYDYDKDKTAYDTDEKNKYARLAQEWKDYRSNLQRAQNIAFKQDDINIRKGNLAWRQAKQANELKKWQNEYDLKMKKQSADEAYKSALVELKKQQQELAKAKGEDEKRLVEAKIKMINATIENNKKKLALENKKENRQGKSKTKTYSRDKHGRVTSVTES